MVELISTEELTGLFQTSMDEEGGSFKENFEQHIPEINKLAALAAVQGFGWFLYPNLLPISVS